MSTAVNVTKDQILAEEESIKEQVYSYFEKKIQESNTAVLKAERELEDGKYESQYMCRHTKEWSRA